MRLLAFCSGLLVTIGTIILCAYFLSPKEESFGWKYPSLNFFNFGDTKNSKRVTYRILNGWNNIEANMRQKYPKWRGNNARDIELLTSHYPNTNRNLDGHTYMGSSQIKSFIINFCDGAKNITNDYLFTDIHRVCVNR